MLRQFRDRTEAGQLLAARLTRYAFRPDVLVLALARGGVPVAFEVAMALHAPLDIFSVRKLGAPGIPELALGAIASRGIRVLNQDIVEELEISKSEIEQVAVREQEQLERFERIFRGDRPPAEVHARTVILVDDGLATGVTMRAAIQGLWQKSPERLIVAVPTAPYRTCQELVSEVDELVCLMMPHAFKAISLWYEDFRQTTDAEVRERLARAARKQSVWERELIAA